MTFRKSCIPLASILAVLLADSASTPTSHLRSTTITRAAPTAAAATPRPQLARLPLRFEENVGQFADGVRFLARRGSAQLAFDDRGATMQVGSSEVRLSVAGGREVTPRAGTQLITKTNYFYGNDPQKWRTNVANYESVTYPNVKDGVDLVYRGEEQGQVEYDFVVHPGAAIDSIAMNVEGGKELSINDEGDLVLRTDDGDFVQHRPRVFQRDADGREVDVASSFRLVNDHSVGFAIAAYDTTRELVIDPALSWGAAIAGNSTDRIWDVAVDANDNVYVAGETVSTANFPVPADAYQNAKAANTDGFVAKLNPDATQLLYATYLGGGGNDIFRGIAVGADGSAYVVGYVSATGYPVTNGTLYSASNDVVVTKLNPAGAALTYSTYYGGTGSDVGYDIAVNAAGEAFFTGTTTSANMATEGAAGGALSGTDAFAAKLNANGSVRWSSYIGGPGTEIGWGIALDAQNRVLVVGQTSNNGFPDRDGQPCHASQNAFVMRLFADGSDYDKSYCFGGSGAEIAYDVAAVGNSAIIVGQLSADTADAPFPRTVDDATPIGGLGGTDGFIVRVSFNNGEYMDYARTLGGSGNDVLTSVKVNTTGRQEIIGTAFVAGYSASPTATPYPLVSPYQPTLGGNNDFVVTKIVPDGTRYNYSTYLGGTGDDQAWGIALDSSHNVILAGQTSNATIAGPSVRVHGQRAGIDGFIARLSTPGPSMNTATPNVPPRGTSTILLNGSNPVLAISDNLSGGRIEDGNKYIAGSVGNVVDVLRGTDSEGGERFLNINVGPGVSVNPAQPSTPPNGTLVLGAQGGSGEGYTWTLTANPSGGNITVDGNYTAGAVQEIDIAKVTDSLGNEATVEIAVGAAIGVNPAAPTAPPRGTLTLVASGGSGAGYAWTLTDAPSGGSITPAGDYTAGATPSVTDVAKVTDSLGNERSINIVVGAGVTPEPSERTVSGGTAITFTATGGKGPYTWSSQALPSGGSILETGLYSAGIVEATVTDILIATDSLGNTGIAQIEVTPIGASSSGGSSSGEISSSSGGATSSSSSGGATSSSGGTEGTSSSSGAATGSSGTGNGDGADGDSDDGGCNCSSAPSSGSALGSLGLIGVAALLTRRRRR